MLKNNIFFLKNKNQTGIRLYISDVFASKCGEKRNISNVGGFEKANPCLVMNQSYWTL